MNATKFTEVEICSPTTYVPAKIYEENSKTDDQLEHDVKETSCGLLSWRPTYLKTWANHNVYTAIFIIASVIRSMTYAYFHSNITTIEKVFGISSGLIGILMSGNDISQILCGMVFAHYSSKRSRPLWISIGMMFTATACFIYGSCQLFWDGNINYTSFNQNFNTSNFGMCSKLPEDEATRLGNGSITCDMRDSNVVPIVLMFIGQFSAGVGFTAVSSLGFTYMDDNVKERHSVLYIGASEALRSLGPIVGYILASICLRIYIIPNEKPQHSIKDPKWLGAWWLGFLIMGTMQLLIIIPMLLFPKHLPSKRKPGPINNAKGQEMPECHSDTSSTKNFMQSLMRLLKNPIVVFHVFSMVPERLGNNGMSTFMPKYLEAEFGQSASSASIFTGMSSKLMMMVGIFAAGVVIWKFKPRTVFVAGWSAFTNIVFVVFILIAMTLDCTEYKYSGVSVHDNRLVVTSTCSQNCNCDLEFDPVCVMGQKHFFSPCLAGCTGLNQTVESPKVFYNCSCGSLELENSQEPLTALSGYCPNTRGTCNLFYVYVTLFGVARLIASTSRVGSLIILIRSVQKGDKSLAMALMTAITSLFGYIPAPIIFGTLADSMCLLWKKTTCGKRGNCWHYDVDQLRYWFHGVTVGCYIISFLFDVLVCIYSRHLNIYEEHCYKKSNTFKDKKKMLRDSNKPNFKLMELATQETKII